jgi:hypothetical protein
MKSFSNCTTRVLGACLVLMLFSYVAGSTQVLAGIKGCQDCACRYAFNWAADSGTPPPPAYGMVDPQTMFQVRQGAGLGSLACDIAPAVALAGAVDRYKWTNYSLICDGSHIRNPTIEATVTGAGNLDANNITHTKCSNN